MDHAPRISPSVRGARVSPGDITEYIAIVNALFTAGFVVRVTTARRRLRNSNSFPNFLPGTRRRLPQNVCHDPTLSQRTGGSMITNIDVTLRDGGYRNGFNFTLDYALEHARRSVDAGFDWVEIAYLKGSFDPSKSTGLTGRGDPDYVRALAQHIGPDHTGLIGHPKNMSYADVAASYDAGARLMRLCLTQSPAESDFAMLTAAKDMGFTVCANLTRVSRLAPREIADLSLRASEAGADVVYLADSNGSLRPSDVGSLINLVEIVTPAAAGLHAHNNLGLALANALAAAGSGATWIDSSVLGMGKGAGNLIAEQWIAYLDRDPTLDSRAVDLGTVLELSDFLAASVAESRPAIPMTDLLMGHFDLSIDQREHFRGSHRDSVLAARDLHGIAS
ncbi:hypothetical protein CH286_05290 [Rhodococcus sp. WWJCD1]|nr:hypothetical protein CH286_05290 [Rhodococcus sp. WWJCD1]